MQSKSSSTTRRTASFAASTPSPLPPEHELDEDDVLAAFLHGARLGVFDMSWNILCPACGGVLDSGATLKTVRQSEYRCVLCAIGHEPTLDEIVEVTFTISPRVRRIAAHDPGTLSWIEYYRQIFWSSGVDLPDNETLAKWVKETTLDSRELLPWRKGGALAPVA